jgi:hypothetical protein
VTGQMAESDLDLVGLSEIVLLLGVDARRTSTITRRRDFPEPCSRISIGRIWHRADVEAWIREHGSAQPRDPLGRAGLR